MATQTPTTDDLHRAYCLSRLSLFGYSYEQAMQIDVMKRAITNTAKAMINILGTIKPGAPVSISARPV